MKTKKFLEHKKYLCNVMKELFAERMVFCNAKAICVSHILNHRKDGLLNQCNAKAICVSHILNHRKDGLLQ